MKVAHGTKTGHVSVSRTGQNEPFLTGQIGPFLTGHKEPYRERLPTCGSAEAVCAVGGMVRHGLRLRLGGCGLDLDGVWAQECMDGRRPAAAPSGTDDGGGPERMGIMG